jgi:hypothetical protein
MQELESLTDRIQGIKLPELNEQEQAAVATATVETTGGNGKDDPVVNDIQPQDTEIDRWKANMLERGFVRLKEDQYHVVIETVWKGFGLPYPGYRNINDMINDLFQGQIEMFLIRGADINELAFMVLDRISEYRRTARVQYFNAQGEPLVILDQLNFLEHAETVRESLPWLKHMHYHNAKSEPVVA